MENSIDVYDSYLLDDYLDSKRRLVILSGAGISAGSGIPTYRDTEGKWLRSPPIQHNDFVRWEESRQRYWLRSYAGWPSVKHAQPTLSHDAITLLERRGIVDLVVTQNVDRLHQKSGTTNVIDLHGRLDQVICLDCGASHKRSWVQEILEEQNPFLSPIAQPAPDGDADIESNQAGLLKLPFCNVCEGTLKPNVVFFGDQVAKDIIQQIYRQLDCADGLLIVGTSLRVFSGYRFCRYAAKINLPIAAINPGRMRGEELINTLIRCEADTALRLIRH